MKRLFFVPLTVVAVIVAGRAGPAENAIVAAMKLAEQPNYSWTATVTDDATTYTIEGKTAAEGWTWMRLPLTKNIARRLGRDAEMEVEALFRSSDAFAILTPKGWKTLAELPKKHPDWSDYDELSVGLGGVASVPAGSTLLGVNDPFLVNDPFFSGAMPIILPHAPPPDPDEDKPYCNAQFALARPHDELAIIVSSHTDLKVEGDTVTGTLSDVGAQLLLVREGASDKVAAGPAAGVFKLRIRNGLVEQYALKLEGILHVGKKSVHVHETSTTVIKNVGSTAFEVPADVQRKLVGFAP